jgi:hypothetical protein
MASPATSKAGNSSLSLVNRIFVPFGWDEVVQLLAMPT